MEGGVLLGHQEYFRSSPAEKPLCWATLCCPLGKEFFPGIRESWRPFSASLSLLPFGGPSRHRPHPLSTTPQLLSFLERIRVTLSYVPPLREG